jgi:Meiotically up-regulated gene 113
MIHFRTAVKDMHFIYMLYCSETALTKIGITDHPRRRQAQITGDCAYPVDLLALWRVPKCLARGFETMLHEAFSHCKHHGEWFKMDRQERDELAAMKSIRFAAIQSPKTMLYAKTSIPDNPFHTDVMIRFL